MFNTLNGTAFFLQRWGSSLIAFLLFLWIVPHTDLSKREARESIPVKIMAQGGSLWLPKINSQRVRTKPPLFYWSGLLSSLALGKVNEISLRLPSVLAGTGTAALTTWLGWRLFSASTGIMAGLILVTSWRFAYLASHARIDMLFAFFITGAFAAFWMMLAAEKAETRDRAGWLAAVALGAAFLTKGPLGWIFPLLALFFFKRINPPGAVPWLRLVLAPLAMVLVWFAAGAAEGGQPFLNMIHQETLGRLTGNASIQIHRKPFYFYIPQIFLGLAPWSLFLPVVLWAGFRIHRKDSRWQYPAAAFTVLFVFLSLVPGKRGDYLLPLYPMAALLIAHFFSRSTFETQRLSNGLKRTTRVFVVLNVILGLLFILASLIPHIPPEKLFGFLSGKDQWMTGLLIERHFPAWPWLAAAAGVMFLFAGGLTLALGKNSPLGVWGGVTGWALLILITVHGPVARVVNQYSSLKPFARQVASTVGQNPLLHYGQAREDLLYYIDRPVREAPRGKTIQTLYRNPRSYLLIRESEVQGVLEKHPRLEVILKTKDSLFKQYRLVRTLSDSANPPL
ncbi:MAG: ArnT family glycosyltransferase [Nitrospinaceae bacterium]